MNFPTCKQLLCVGLLAALPWPAARAEALSPTPLQPWESADGLPAAKQGRFPVMLPKYEGVDQLIVLSSRWVVVVTNNVDAVFAKVDALSDGALSLAIKTWDASAKVDQPNWNAYRARGAIYDKFAAKAREELGERLLDAPATYAITGSDPAYQGGKAPTRVTRMIVGLGQNVGPAQNKLRGVLSVYYAHYSYLELPTPLQSGQSYAIALQDGRKVSFVYDETRTVSRAIKVNQAGYLSDATHKYAYLGAYLHEFGPHDFAWAKTFKVVSVQTGEVVYSGDIRLREKNPRFTGAVAKDAASDQRPLIDGEDVYELDLAGLKAEGEFFITIPGVGRSWTFRHGKDALAEAFYTVTRNLFHQRCGIALEAKNTAWTHPACHTEPVYESDALPWCPGADFRSPGNYERFDVIGGSIRAGEDDESTKPCGGWHDASDWDRNIHHYVCVFNLLYAFELMPKKFTDGQLNIPESGNGIPDVLDEAEFGIEIWKRSMSAEGGVSGMVETYTHPAFNDPNIKYAFSRRTRWSSLVFAAAAAQYAHLVKPFNAAKAAEYEALAKKAFAFGSNPKNSLGAIEIEAKSKRGEGRAYSMSWQETDAMIQPFLLHAKSRLCILTGDDSYLKGLPELTKGMRMPYVWPNTWSDFVPWLYFDMPHQLAAKLPPDLTQTWKEYFIRRGVECAALNERMPYRCSWPRDQDGSMGWGATTMTNYSRGELIAMALGGDPAKLRDAALQNVDFMFGANSLGFSFTTGVGYTYPIDIQHELSEADGITDPVPGITIYGLTGGWFYPELRNRAWNAPGGEGQKEGVMFVHKENLAAIPVFRRLSIHPHQNVGQCEFTIAETTSGMIFTLANFLPEGWMPSAELKARKPRPDPFLFGYYFLP